MRPIRVARSLGVVKTLLILLVTAATMFAAEPTRQDGLSIHLLPDRVAKIGGGHGGFTVTDPETRERGATYAEPKELLAYFQHLPMSVQLNGIWIVTTHPSSYSEGERTKLKALAATCGEKKIPVYVCRASELPEGWKRLE